MIKKQIGILSLLFLSFLVLSCRSELARIDMTQLDNIEIQVNCEKHRQIDFYLDCDIEYSEVPVMVMDFEFYRGKEQILKGGLDPLAASPKENETKTKQGEIIHWSFYGKLEGNFVPPADTIFFIRPKLIKNNYPQLKINKFDLVLVR